MMTEYISGDLFDNTHDAWAFARGCQCEGSTGAGIARTLNLASCCPGMLSVTVRGIAHAETARMRIGYRRLTRITTPEHGSSLPPANPTQESYGISRHAWKQRRVKRFDRAGSRKVEKGPGQWRDQ